MNILVPSVPAVTTGPLNAWCYLSVPQDLLYAACPCHLGCSSPSPVWPCQDRGPGLFVNTATALLCHLARQGLRIIESPRDGHCPIHSIRSSRHNQLPHFKPVDIVCVKSKTVSNVNHYTLAVGPSVLLKQQKSYLSHRNFDSEFSDALPPVIANVLNIKLDILNETLQDVFDVVPVIPKVHGWTLLEQVHIQWKVRIVYFCVVFNWFWKA